MAKPCLTKEEFVEYIGEILETSKKDNEFSEAIEKICGGDCWVIGAYSKEISIMISLLAKVMGLPADNTPDENIIQYFVYDLDFGKEYTEGCFTEIDGTSIDISTAEKLYDYITGFERD